MDLTLTDDQRAIEDSVGRITARFGDDYWSECDSTPRFPAEFHKAMADGGWMGIAMPPEYGGAGLGVTEAALMMHKSHKAAAGFRRPLPFTSICSGRMRLSCMAPMNKKRGSCRR